MIRTVSCPDCGAASRVLETRNKRRRFECPGGHRFTEVDQRPLGRIATVIEYFRTHPQAKLTTRDIAHLCGVTERNARKFLSVARARGQVTVLHRGQHNAPVYGPGTGVGAVVPKKPVRTKRQAEKQILQAVAEIGRSMGW